MVDKLWFPEEVHFYCKLIDMCQEHLAKGGTLECQSICINPPLAGVGNYYRRAAELML